MVMYTAREMQRSACSDTDLRDSRSISRAIWGTAARSRAVCVWWTRTAVRDRSDSERDHRHTACYTRSSSSSWTCGFVARTSQSRTPAESTRERHLPDPCTCCGILDGIYNVQMTAWLVENRFITILTSRAGFRGGMGGPRAPGLPPKGASHQTIQFLFRAHYRVN